MIEKLREAYITYIEKKGYLELQLVSALGEEKFYLEKKIYECDEKINQLKQAIQEFSNDPFLNSAIPSGGLILDREVTAHDAVPTATAGADVNPAFVSEPENAAHLVIAAFFRHTRDSQKFWLVNTLFYHDQNGQQQQIRLSTDQEFDDIKAAKFPEYLRTLTRCVLEQLEDIAPSSEYPWYLNVEVFVPTEFLGEPLSKWCASSSTLMRDYPIVLGCSDRFHPDIKYASELRNKMRQGWQRLQQDIPDAENLPLARLRWLNSDQADQQSLEAYSGFRCYGGWLKAGQKHLEKWTDLVRSGIPIALWMCEGTPDRVDTETIFNQIARHNRFDFLEALRTMRDRQQRTCDHRLGVFYENPKYSPDFRAVKLAWPQAGQTPEGKN